MEQGVVRSSELIETLQRYADLFTFAPVGFAVLCEDSRVEDVNRAAAAMLGWPRSWMAGQLFARWIAKTDSDRFFTHLRNACRSERVITDEFRIKDRRGRTRELRFDSVAMISRERDGCGATRRCQMSMTEAALRRRDGREGGGLSEDLAHVARLNSCGEMAAALAHELSQPLGAITLHCNTAVKTLRSGDFDPAYIAASLEKISEAALHASATIHGLRSFLSKRKHEVECLQLNEVLRNTTRLAAAYAKERGCRVELRLAEGLPPVHARVVHLQQVLLNLLQNSIDAMQESSSGDRLILVISDRPRPDTLRVTVVDSGPGMTDQQRRHAFEPFYTTKENGMGMGLSISRSIIESYGGRLWARRGQRRGTALSFTLPAYEQY